MTLRLKYIIIGLLLAGGGFALAQIFGSSPDEELAKKLADETRDKNSAQQLALSLRDTVDELYEKLNQTLQQQKETVTVQAAATIQQVYDTKSVWEIIRNYERNRAATRVSRPQEKITAIDEAGARVGITELKYITAVNIEHSEYKRNLAITEQQTEQFRQRVNSLKSGLDTCGAFLRRANEKLAVAEENAVPNLPFVKGLFLEFGMYGAFNKPFLDMQSKAYAGMFGVTFQTRDFQFEPLVGGVAYPVKKYDVDEAGQRYNEQLTSETSFGYALRGKWYFTKN